MRTCCMCHSYVWGVRGLAGPPVANALLVLQEEIGRLVQQMLDDFGPDRKSVV